MLNKEEFEKNKALIFASVDQLEQMKYIFQLNSNEAYAPCSKGGR